MKRHSYESMSQAPAISSTTRACVWDETLKTTIHRFDASSPRKCRCGEVDHTAKYEAIDAAVIAKLMK